MATNRCTNCKKFLKKDVQLDERGYCPACQQLHPITNEEANEVDVNENKDLVAENVTEGGAAEINDETTLEDAQATAGLDLDVTKLVERSKKGVTNKQMIPAMKTYIDGGEIDKLRVLKAVFPGVFESTTKYIGHARQEKLKTMAI